MKALLLAAGREGLELARGVGGMAVLLGRLARRLWPPRADRDELVRSLHGMAVQSLPLVVVTALFVGAIMVVQAAPLVRSFGAEGLVGWAAGFGTLREIAPLLTALMISGRVGSNTTAELGTMVITEQIDALRVLAIDPYGFLVLPRFLALVATLFMMTLWADLLALAGAAATSQLLLGVEPASFFAGVTGGLLGFVDVASGLVKSVAFGIAIGLSSCHHGLRVRGGAPGVGRAVTASVVTSATAVFLCDYLLSFVLP